MAVLSFTVGLSLHDRGLHATGQSCRPIPTCAPIRVIQDLTANGFPIRLLKGQNLKLPELPLCKLRKSLHLISVKAEDIHCEVTPMLQKALLFAATVGSGLFVLTGQQPAQTSVFTSAQAEAGRISYENTCARCHTYSLHGRKGEAGELSPVSSLSKADQKFIGNPNYIPPLAGEAFLNRWGEKTVAQLIDRLQITVSDPSFKFKDIDDDTTANITAYVLPVNGAKAGAQPLTRTTRVVVNSTIK